MSKEQGSESAVSRSQFLKEEEMAKEKEAPKKVTRREFVKGAAVGGAGVAAAGVLASCAPAAPTTGPEAAPTCAPAATPWIPEKWDEEADVVVIGTGCAGMAASIEAVDNGAKVITLEKMSVTGGTTAMAGGSSAIPVKGKESDAIEYYMACGDGKVSREMVEAFVEETATLGDWFQSVGGFVLGDPRAGYHLMFPGADGSLQSWGAPPEGNGGEWVMETEVNAALARGVNIMMETTAVELIATPEKEVLGVKAESNGTVINIKAGKGVVLACGGIGFNEELKLQWGRSWPKYHTGSPGNTGDGILMGMKLGAAVWKTPEGIGRPCIKIPEYQIAYGFGYANQPCVIVNRYGKRFVAENISYDSFHMACDSYDATKREFTNIPWYAIFDEEVRLIARVGSPPRVLHDLPDWSADNSDEITKGWIIRADTIEELAGKIGIDPVALGEAVDTYNTNAEVGVDPEFGRTGAGLAPVRTPPFYAVEGYAGYYGTFGSLQINTKAQVIDVSGAVIPRLYAAGENAIGHLGYHYPSGGNGIADGHAFGRIAGRLAAASTPWA